MDIGCYLIHTSRYAFAQEPTRVIALVDRDPQMRTDRLTSAILDFPGTSRRFCVCFIFSSYSARPQPSTVKRRTGGAPAEAFGKQIHGRPFSTAGEFNPAFYFD